MSRFLARRRARILVTFAAAILSPALSQAADLFWDGTGTSWSLAGAWSTSSSSSLPDPSPLPPGASDIATFNITTVNTAQTVNLDAPQSALGLVFNSTGTVLIESAAGGGSANSLTLGASGITLGAGAGADTISAPAILTTPQTWVNNSSSIFTVSGGVNLQANGLTIDGAATTTFSSALSGTGGVTKNGSADLRLNASNAFTGGLTINAGAVILGNAGALNSTTPNAVSFGAGSTGTLTLNGNSVTVSGLSTNATVGSPFVENKSATPATLTVNNTSIITYAGILQDSAGGGALSLTKGGAGILSLGGANTYTGATTISAGTLQFAQEASLYNNNHANWTAATLVVFSGATAAFNVGGTSEFTASDIQTLSNLGTATGGFKNGSTLGLDTTNAAGGQFDYSSVIANPNAGANTLSLTKLGSGALQLSGANTFTGGLTINAGQVILGNAGALNSTTPNAVVFGAGSTAALTLNGNSITVSRLTTDATTVGSPLVENKSATPATLTINNSTIITYAGVLQDGAGGGALSLSKGGASILILGGANAYTGATTINAGTLLLGNASALGGAAGGTTIASGATLDLGGQTVGAEPLTIAGSGVGANGALGNSSATAASLAGTVTANGPFTVGGTGNITLSGSVNGANQVLTKIGNNTLTLSGTTDNNSLAVTVNSGTVVLAKTSSGSPNDVHAIGQDMLTVNGGTAQLGGTGGDQIFDLGGVTVTFGAFDANGRNETIATLSLQGTGFGGTGALVNSASAATSILTVTGGTVLTANTTIGVPSASSSIELDNPISGNFALTKGGSGALKLGGSNTYTGVTTIAAGTVQFGRETSLYNNNHANWTAATLVVFSGATAAFNVGGTGEFTASDIQTISSLGTTTGGFRSGSNLSLDTTHAAGGLFNETSVIANPNAGANALSLTKLGSGALQLSGSNTFTGGLTINAGAVILGNAGALNSTTPNAVSFGAGSTGTLTLNGNSVTVSGLSTNATVGSPFVENKSATPATLSVQNSIQNIYAGVLQDGVGGGALSLTKGGAGTLKFGGTNTYTGATTISAGTLQLAQEASLYNNNHANWTAATLVVFSGATAAFNVGGTGEFTASDIQTLSSLGTATGGFKNGSTLGLDTTNAAAGQFDYSSVIANPNAGANALSLTKLGSGALQLSGSNTFTGGVTIASGTLLVGDNAALGSGPLSFSNTSAAIAASGGSRVISNPVNLGTGVFVFGSNDLTFTSPITLTASITTIKPFGTGITTLSGNISESGTKTLFFSGTGTVRLSGNNTFSGGVSLSGATLLIGNSSALGNPSPGNPALALGGTLEAEGGPLTITPIVSIENGAGVDGPNDIQFNQCVASGTLTKNGTGTLTLGSFVDNMQAQTIGFVVNSGTVRLPTSLPINSLVRLTTVTVNNSAIFDLNGLVLGIDNLQLSGGLVNASGELHFSDSQPEQVTTLASAQTAAISTRLFLATNQVFNIADGPAVLDLDVPATLSDSVLGPSTLTKSGAGTLRLSGANTFTGPVTVNAGTLIVANSSALGASNVLTINGGAVDLGTFTSATSHVNLNAGSLSMTGNLTIGSAGLLGQNINLDATKSLTVSGTTTIDPSGTMTVSGGTFNTGVLAGAAAFTFINGTLGITGSDGLTIGNGSLTGASFSLGASDHLNVTNLLHIAGTGRLTNSGANVVVGSALIDAGGRWTVSDGAQSVGTGLVNHGTLVLLDTTINGPVSSPAGSTVTVVGGVTFNQLVSGAGQFFGPGTATFNGGYSPGDSPASINFQGGVTLGAANTLTIDVGGTTPGNGPNHHDQVNVAGTAALDGTLALAPFNGFVPVSGDKFIVMTYANETGTFSSITGTSPAPGLTYSAVYQPTSLVIITTTNGDKTWGVDSDGSSSLAANWIGGVAPGGIGDSATFSTIITANRTVTLDADTIVGTLTFDSPNNYRIAGTNMLTLQAAGATAAAINVSGVHGNGSHTISAPVTLASDLNITQNSGGVFTISGPLNNAAGRQINVSGAGTAAITGSINLGKATSLSASGTSTLRFGLTSGAATIGTGVTATVSDSATLELAGSVSALSTGSSRVNVVNNSSAATGVLVSGTNQVVGGIDGSGTTQVNAGSDLTANHIIQSSLVIGGTAGSPAQVTIDASDASGNPLDQPSGFALADSLAPSGAFGMPDTSLASMNTATAGSADLGILAIGKSVASDNPAPVPEPPTLLLAFLAVLGVIGQRIAMRRRARWNES